jgi:hypothetical protein
MVQDPIVQGNCASSWAIVAGDGVESAYNIKQNAGGLKTKFSRQQLLDCTPDYIGTGCQGG